MKVLLISSSNASDPGDHSLLHKLGHALRVKPHRDLCLGGRGRDRRSQLQSVHDPQVVFDARNEGREERISTAASLTVCTGIGWTR